MSLNKVMLLGNVGQDPNVRTLKDGIIASISLATSERYKDRNGDTKENTEWHSVQVFGKTAEFVQNYVNKGDQLFVEGKIRTRKYTDKNGVERTVTEVVAENVQRIANKLEQPKRVKQVRPVEDLPVDDETDGLPF